MSLLQGSWLIEPYEIPDFRRLASLMGVFLRPESEQEVVQQVFEACGEDPVFSHNFAIIRKRLNLAVDALPPGLLAFFRNSGLLDAQPLRTVRGPVTRVPRVTALICSGSASQMEGSIKEALKQHRKGKVFIEQFVGLADSKRLCDAPEEIWDQNVVALKERMNSRRPTEGRLLRSLFDDIPCNFVRQTVILSKRPQFELQLKDFARQYMPTSVYVPTTAGTQYLALQVRRILQLKWGEDFDQNDQDARLVTSSAALPMATNVDQCEKPHRFVHPFAVLSGVAHFAREVALAGMS